MARTKRTPSQGDKTSLRDYARRRDFARTPEPKPGPAHAEGREFVVQKHAARRLHYDLRLELDGVLKSWAVTRGPSLTTGEKRLAIQTEDHPIDYLEFEGNIPKGEYGGGSVIVWDRGKWVPEGDPHRGLAKGHLAFSLEGSRLKGRWHLVHLRSQPGKKANAWLLIKSDDDFARDPGSQEVTDEELTSLLSGRTTEALEASGELRKDHKARVAVEADRPGNLSGIGRISGARKALLPVFVEPCLASLSEQPPSGANWIHEIKYDGYRIQARIDGSRIRLLTRGKLDWTQRFQSVASGLKDLRVGSALIDGEIVVEDASGISSFNGLQADLKNGRLDRFRYYVFDLLYCSGFDLTGVALIDRKDLLQKIMAGMPAGSCIRLSEYLEQDGPTVLQHACQFSLEGIISKRRDTRYSPGRSTYWLKSKCVESQEFVIVGYIPSTAARESVGALLLAYYEDKQLVYVGRVGTGWSAKVAKSLRDDLESLGATKPHFGKALPAGAEKGVRWAEPKLVCEIEYRSWTEDRLLRQASFKGIREDKPAEEVTLESRPRTAKKAPETPDIGGIHLTHPERLLFEDGVTKLALAEFYAEIAKWILPHISNRVLTLVRCPSGISQKAFYAKHPWAGLGERLFRVDVGEKEPMLALNDIAGLVSLVQSDVVEIHSWGSSVDHLEEPDRLVFDLDPGEDVPWSAVIEGAVEVRQRLEDLGLKSFVKTTGGKGLHVVVPVKPEAGWDEAKAFTASLAQQMVKARPDRYVATATKRVRGGRIFIDYLRNGRGATSVAPFSTRALPQASVSTPLAWEELSEAISSRHFKVDNLRQRLEFLQTDPWEGFFRLRQRLPRPTRGRRPTS